MSVMYEEYIEDYLIEAINEMRKYHYQPLLEATDKSSVYKINYYLRDNLQIPFVSGVLEKRKNRDSLVAFVAKFMDDHEYQLSTPGPIHSFTFGDKETSFLYDMFSIKGDQLYQMFLNMVQETFYGKISKFFDGFVKTAPHKLLITAMLIEGLQKEYQEVVEVCEYLWAFCEYPILYRKFWPTDVREDVMIYTIEHLSAKYKVTKVSNLQALLKYDANVSVKSNKDSLLTGADHSYTDFMQRMRSQLNNTLTNISRAYYDNVKANATHHNATTVFDDGTIADQEGHLTNISQSVDKTLNKFGTREINTSIIKITSERNKVDKDNLINFINQIYSTKNNRLSRFLELVITSYFNRNPTDSTLGTSEFLNFGLAMYRSIGTSKDPMYQEVKEILAYWMNDIINIRGTYNREATVISYTRAVYDYMILMINHYN